MSNITAPAWCNTPHNTGIWPLHIITVIIPNKPELSTYQKNHLAASPTAYEPAPENPFVKQSQSQVKTACKQ